MFLGLEEIIPTACPEYSGGGIFGVHGRNSKQYLQIQNIPLNVI
jgi:hypothetical protein